jgi:hypothetical protein
MISYVMSFATLNLFPAKIYLLPWYSSPNRDLTALGLRESALAMVALTVGAEIVLRRRRGARVVDPPQRPALVDSALVNFYLVTGLLMYAVVAPQASWIPTIGTVVSMGSTLVVVGLVLKFWNASRSGRRRAAAAWLTASALFPLVTVMGQGFLGYGFAASLSVFVFAASWSRTRLVHVAAGLLVAYLGMSIYVTYMRDRADIRDVVWGAATYEKRGARLWATATQPEWFNPADPQHLLRIDQRLNQNFLVGSAVDYLGNGFAEFGRGETFWAALVAPVPRALWPDKPVEAGGAELASAYTGYRFHGTTSVGVGQVMESYVNFGSAGVLVGFCLIGIVLASVDRAAAQVLAAGRVQRFLLWYFPGLSLLQLGGSLSEVTGSAAASLLLAYLLNSATTLLFKDRGVADVDLPDDPERAQVSP